jgi:hypothetical protein
MQDKHSSRADSFFPGYTLFSVGGMAQGGEWSVLHTLFGVGGMAQGGE